MKKKRLLPLFLLLTPMLVANSPAPYRGPESYPDYSVTNFSYVSEGEQYKYSFDLSNVGEGYICFETSLTTSNRYLEIDNIVPWDDEVILPGKTKTMEFTADAVYSQEDIAFDVRGYKEFLVPNAATYSDISAFTKKYNPDYVDGCFEYSFTCEYSKNTDEFGNYYAPIFTISDGVNTYGFKGEFLSKNYTFRTKLDLDETKLSIVSYTFVEGYEYYRHRGSFDIGKLLYYFIIILAVITAFLCISACIGGVVVGIIFVVRNAKKQEREKETKSQTIDDKEDNS